MTDLAVSYEYKGWRITFDSKRPVTGTWRADRFGVGMCNNSRESIQRMVDVKAKEKGEQQ